MLSQDSTKHEDLYLCLYYGSHLSHDCKYTGILKNMFSKLARVSCFMCFGLNVPVQETSETWVQSLSQEDPLEEGMATHFSILA